MPRTAREKSGSNIYHVMLRGINRQNIFEDDQDRMRFMSVLSCCKRISEFRLHAFVLMSNHVHLLIEPAGEPLDLVFRRIGIRYAAWYNSKYQRTGHLFQDRYRSERVDTDAYYRTVLRYILQNPMKAGMESCPGTYRWSSYLGYEKGKSMLTDMEYALDLFGSRETLVAYLREQNEDVAMDEADFDRRLRDDAAKEIIRRITGCASVSEYQKLDPPAQKEYAGELYLEGLSLGQIARMTGMSKTTVHRAARKARDEFPGEEGLPLREQEEEIFGLDFETVW